MPIAVALFAGRFEFIGCVLWRVASVGCVSFDAALLLGGLAEDRFSGVGVAGDAETAGCDTGVRTPGSDTDGAEELLKTRFGEFEGDASVALAGLAALAFELAVDVAL